MTTQPHFMCDADRALNQRMLGDGHIILPAEDRDSLDRIRDLVAQLTADHLGLSRPNESGEFLDGIAAHVAVDRLNDLRLAVIDGLNAETWVRPAYFALARAGLEAVVGNELVMQRRVNLSIQLPDDDSSLLPIHSDVWSGDSPYEVVLWVPLVDCYASKSMFFLPPEKGGADGDRLDGLRHGSVEALFRSIESDVLWLDVPYGSVALFTQNCLHGNRVNHEPATRWTMNCRFKSVFSPYADKRLGEFFEPITLRAATRFGMGYRLPGGFDV